MKNIEFSLDGLSCESCVKSVTNHFMEVPGVKTVNIDLSSKKAKVLSEDHVSLEDLSQSLESSHYKIVK